MHQKKAIENHSVQQDFPISPSPLCPTSMYKIAAFYENDYSPVHKQYTMLDVSLPSSPYTVESTTNLSEGKGHCVQLLLLCSGGSVWLGVLSRKMKRGWEKRTCGSISRAVWTIIISKAWNHVVMLCSHSTTPGVLSTRSDMQIVSPEWWTTRPSYRSVLDTNDRAWCRCASCRVRTGFTP